MIRLAFFGVLRRWARVLTAVIGIGLAISIAYVLTGVTRGFESETDRTLDTLGAHYLIPKASSGLLNGLIDDGAGPEGSSPVLFGRDALPSKGVDLNVFGVAEGSVSVAQGRGFEAPNEMIADRSAGLALGETLDLAGRELNVVGLTEGVRIYAGGPVVFLSLQDVQEMYFNGQPVARMFTTPEPVAGTELLKPMPHRDAKRDLDRSVKGAISTISLTRTLLWAMVAGIVFVLNRLTMLDRKPELATLKTLGSGTLSISWGLVLEAAIVGLFGAIAGCALGEAIAPLFPLAVESSLDIAVDAASLSVAVSLLAALFGTIMLRRIRPGDAFRSEI